MTHRLVPLGEIVTTHGIAGWVKLNPYNPETSFFSRPRRVVLERDGSRFDHEIESSRRQRNQIVLKLRGVDDVETARKLVGCTVMAREADLDSLAPGEYYHYQVVGLEVYDTEGRKIGVVTRTWHTAGGDLYVVTGDSKEHLIPAVKEFIEKVDFTAGKIIVTLPEGLLEL